jgi:SAM-dependent methyltransferase
MDNVEHNSKLTSDIVKRLKVKGPGPGLKKRHTRMFELVTKYTKKNNSVIDLGGREGFFLSRLKDVGYKDLYCIDASDEAIQFLHERGLEGHVSDISGNLKVDRKFDVVILSHVLEHCPVPLDVLNNIYDILDVGGLLFVEVPNEPFKKFPTKYGHYYGFNSYKDFTKFLDSRWKVIYKDKEGGFRFVVKKER